MKLYTCFSEEQWRRGQSVCILPHAKHGPDCRPRQVPPQTRRFQSDGPTRHAQEGSGQYFCFWNSIL